MAGIENRLHRLEKRLTDRGGERSKWFVNEDGSPAVISGYEFANRFQWVKEVAKPDTE